MSGIRGRVEMPKGLPKDLNSEIEKAALTAMNQGLQLIANDARSAAPVKTGAMRRSITVEEAKASGNSITGAVGAGGSGAPYAKAVEFGSGVYSEADDSSHQPIVIRPVHAKALAWPSAAMGAPGGAFRRLSGNLRTSVLRQIATGAMPASSAYTFAKKVVQQGNRPRPFLRPAFEKNQSRVLDFLAQQFSKLFG